MRTRIRAAAIAVVVVSAAAGFIACIDADGLEAGDLDSHGATTRDATTVVIEPASDGGGVVISSDSGCGANVQTDPLNCGTCGHVCALTDGAAGSVESCSMGVCVAACTSGRGDCNGVPGDGCESTLAGDAKNCGACGRDCGGGSCTDGVCGAVDLVAPSDAGTSVRRLIVDADRLYYTTNAPAGVWSLAKSGGTPILLTAATTPVGLVLVGSTLYFADNGSNQIGSVQTDGGASTITVASAPTVYDLATNRTSIYGSAISPGRVGLVSPAAGTFDTLYPQSDYPEALAANSTAVFSLTESWLGAIPDAGTGTNGTVYRCTLSPACTTPTAFATGQSRPFDVSVDATNVYWATQGTGEHDGTIAMCAATGCPVLGPTILARGLAQPRRVISDGTAIFWTDPGEGVVRSLALSASSGTSGDAGADGGAAGSRIVAAAPGALQLAVDDMYVYWSDSSAGIFRVRK